MRRAIPWITALYLAVCAAVSTAADASSEFVYPRSLEAVRSGLRAIASSPLPADIDAMDRERMLALARLQQYRFLCGVPYKDLSLDAEMNTAATAAADICQRLQKLSHTPENPGLPEEEYQKAKAAAGRCNLAYGTQTLTAAIDMWMDDSSPGTIEHLGHRRWCLNPGMLKLGLGRVRDYTAMWCFDNSRTPAFDYDFISFPPPGYVPVDLFKPQFAWSVTLNPKTYEPPKLTALAISLFPIHGELVDREHSLELENLAVDTQGYGVPNCVIFRPKSLDARPGKRYWLEVGGLTRVGGEPKADSFVVHFVESVGK